MRFPVHLRALTLYLVHLFAMSTLTVQGLNVALPLITREFGTSVATAAWIQLAYFLALAAGTFAFGQTTTLLDKRKLVIFGLLADVALMTSIFYATNIYYVMVARALSAIVRIYPWLILQVIGIAGFPASQRGRVLGLVAVVQGASMLAAPLVGGFFTETWGWRWLFLACSALYVAMSPLVWWLIPAEPRPANAPRPRLAQFDIPGSLLMIGGMTALLVALQLVIRGVGDGWALPLGVGGLVGLVAFITVELRASAPIIPFTIFRDRQVLSGTLQAVAVGWVNGSVVLVLPFLFQSGYGWSVSAAAGILLFLNAVRPVSGLLSGWLTDRYGAARVVLLAAGATVLGQLLIATLGATPTVAVLVAALLITGAGHTFIQTANQQQLFAAIPRGLLHLAPSTNLVLSNTGSTLGQALVAATLVGGGLAGVADAAIVGQATRALLLITGGFVALLVAAQALGLLLRRASPGDAPGEVVTPR